MLRPASPIGYRAFIRGNNAKHDATSFRIVKLGPGEVWITSLPTHIGVSSAQNHQLPTYRAMGKHAEVDTASIVEPEKVGLATAAVLC